jgi:hypothetical protein
MGPSAAADVVVPSSPPPPSSSPSMTKAGDRLFFFFSPRRASRLYSAVVVVVVDVVVVDVDVVVVVGGAPLLFAPTKRRHGEWGRGGENASILDRALDRATVAATITRRLPGERRLLEDATIVLVGVCGWTYLPSVIII